MICFQFPLSETDLNKQKLFNERHPYLFILYVDSITFPQIEVKKVQNSNNRLNK